MTQPIHPEAVKAAMEIYDPHQTKRQVASIISRHIQSLYERIAELEPFVHELHYLMCHTCTCSFSATAKCRFCLANEQYYKMYPERKEIETP